MGVLLYNMASRLKDTRRVAFLADSIAQRKLCTELQVTGEARLEAVTALVHAV